MAEIEQETFAADARIWFGIGSKRVMTQEWADFLYNIAGIAKALAHDPRHADQERILKVLRLAFADGEQAKMFVPETGFTWRIDEWDIKKAHRK